MELYTDTYYIQRVLSGDTACFACLLDKYSTQVYSLIFRVVRNREDAEELSQDVFVKAFRSLQAFKGDCSFSTWIYRIAYNTAVSHTRKIRYEFLAIEDNQLSNVSEEEVSEMLGQVQNDEQIERLERALDAIPADERAIVLLFYMQEKSVDEVSVITGLTPSNVKTKLHRTRKKLFLLLKEMED